MICPSCGYSLQKLNVTTNSGGRFEIDHCGRCGGTWFDPYEVNRIPYHEVVSLAHLTVLPKTPQPALKTRFCPRCHRELSQFHGESVPRNVRLLRCNRCHGIWATQKALEEFKVHQEETISEYKKSGTAFPALSVVFVPALFTLLLFISTFITISHFQEAKENRIKAEAQIQNLSVLPVSATSVAISFQTATLVKSTISYGPSSWELETRTISASFSTNHRIFLTSLKSNTVYLYKIELEDQYGGRFASEIHSFTTLP